MYRQDWLTRQIEIIAETLARILFHRGPVREQATAEQKATGAPGETLAETLLAMVRAGEACRAEDLLYDRLDSEDSGTLLAALQFYSALNALPDEALAAQNFPRDEILSGLTDVCRRLGLEDMVCVLSGAESEADE